MNSYEDTDRVNALIIQIRLLKEWLADCEESWEKYHTVAVRNPVAENIRHQIAEKEALLRSYPGT